MQWVANKLQISRIFRWNVKRLGEWHQPHVRLLPPTRAINAVFNILKITKMKMSSDTPTAVHDDTQHVSTNFRSALSITGKNCRACATESSRVQIAIANGADGLIFAKHHLLRRFVLQ